MDGLSLVFPVALVACDIQQIFVGIHIVLTHESRCIGNDILGYARLARYLHGKAAARIAHLQLEERLHLLPVVEHRTVYHAWSILGKVLEVLVVRGDYTKGSPAHEALQNRLGNGTAYGWLCASTELVNKQQACRIGIAHHLLHVLQVSAIGTQVVLDALFIAYIYQYMVEHTALGVLAHGDRQSALKHIL